MKKITNLLVVISLALAGAVMAQQPTPSEEQEKSSRGKDRKSPAANAMTSPSTSPATATTSATPATTKTNRKSATTKTTATPATATTSATPAASAAATIPATTPTSTTPPTTTASTTPTTTTASTTPAAATTSSASAAPSVSSSTAASTNTIATKPKPAPQQIQQIKQQHMSFRAEPRPDRVPPVTFSANFRLPGSEQWQGPQYEVYRSYHPERHDRGWYSSHSQRVELIAGGYYYFNNGYWYPSWGYDPGHEYYAYDAPIYSGKGSEPPAKVSADRQAALQEMRCSWGLVDGLAGLLTRAV